MDVLPCSSGIDRHDGGLRDAVSRCDVALLQPALGAQPSDFMDLRDRNACHWVRLAAQAVVSAMVIPAPHARACCAALLSAVGIVLGNRGNEQMRWVTAGRIVAAVADAHASWWRAVNEMVCDTVRGQRGLISRRRIAPSECAVSARVAGASPRPAIVWTAALYAVPEMRNESEQAALVTHTHSISPERA